jgi:hypothetical protein
MVNGSFALVSTAQDTFAKIQCATIDTNGECKIWLSSSFNMNEKIIFTYPARRE